MKKKLILISEIFFMILFVGVNLSVGLRFKDNVSIRNLEAQALQMKTRSCNTGQISDEGCPMMYCGYCLERRIEVTGDGYCNWWE